MPSPVFRPPISVCEEICRTSASSGNFVRLTVFEVIERPGID
jgi:hypothetical protein